MKKKHLLITFMLLCCTLCTAWAQTFRIQGRVRHGFTGAPLINANIVLSESHRGTISNTQGLFEFNQITPGTYQLSVSFVGFETWVSDEFPISNQDYWIEVFLDPSHELIPEIVVAPNPFRKNTESPLSLSRIQFRDIEKSAGANRDISRVVQSYPGVSSPTGFRNDLIVRGGGPSENKFFIDGVEIPQINHFATQGASGGPVSILNADMIQSVDFYTGAFPTYRNSALSSILDMKLRRATSSKPSFKLTLGASEIAFSSESRIGERFSYQVSLRRSYLQFLFKILDLPFLPTYNDGQFKLNYQLSPNSELSLLAIGAIDRMTLNFDTDPEDKGNQYLLSSLPTQNQDSYTLAAIYTLRRERAQHKFYLRRSFFYNEIEKYLDNIRDPQGLILDYGAHEIWHQANSEHQIPLPLGKLQVGASLSHVQYKNSTFQQLFYDSLTQINYEADLHLLLYALHGSWQFGWGATKSSIGLRLEGLNYDSYLANPLHQISPRAAFSWEFARGLFWNTQTGLYHQMPALTSLGFKENGRFVNKDMNLRFQRSWQIATGVNYNLSRKANFTAEVFYKHYSHAPISVKDQIPLASKGADFGIWGHEQITSAGKGRAYGLELSAKLIDVSHFSLQGSYTWVRSEFEVPRLDYHYLPSSWDNRNLFTATAFYELPKNWDIGSKIRVIGGAPYTPYDLAKSSLVQAWDAQGSLYYDYSQFNALRGDAFYQIDLRVDKSFRIKGVLMGLYLDIQNITNSQYQRPDVYLSTGKILNPGAPLDQQHYELEAVEVSDGTILPTLGVSVEF